MHDPGIFVYDYVLCIIPLIALLKHFSCRGGEEAEAGGIAPAPRGEASREAAARDPGEQGT